jgi:tripartite-type tricarboxylate transporter receptor subunit TctC
MIDRRRLIAGSAAGLLAAPSLVSRAFAQAVKKPVHIIVGFPAGGGTDVTARVLAEGLRGAYASTVLVENKPGASARLAVEYVKNAEPDGSVMLSRRTSR